MKNNKIIIIIKKLLELFKEGKVTVELEELGEDFLRFINNDVYLEILAEIPEELKEKIILTTWN